MTDDQTTPAPRPHVRAGSIAWGIIVIATASLVLWVVSDTGRRDAAIDWVIGLTPATATLVGVLTIGGILVIAGVLAGIRRLQRR